MLPLSELSKEQANAIGNHWVVFSFWLHQYQLMLPSWFPGFVPVILHLFKFYYPILLLNVQIITLIDEILSEEAIIVELKHEQYVFTPQDNLASFFTDMACRSQMQN